MSPFAVRVEPIGSASAVTARMRGMASRAADFIPAFGVIDTSFSLIEKAKFAQEGPGWPALADSTAAYKASMGFSPKILGPRTGVLEASLTAHGTGSILKTTPYSITMGTNVSYAIFHQLGMPANPLRPLVKITPAQATLWITILRDWFLRGVLTNAYRPYWTSGALA